MKDKNRIFRIILSCLAIVIIFGYTIMAEEDEEENRNTSIKFNQMPIVEIRPINDKINKTTDGSVELFTSNPSSNQFPLQVDFLAIVPSEINLYSDTLPLDEKPEAVIGSFQVMPGQKREIYIRVKSNNIGNYSVQYNEVYYPVGNRRDNVKNVIMHYIVEEPSMSTFNPGIPNDTNLSVPAAKTSSFISIWIIFAIVILIFLYRKMR